MNQLISFSILVFLVVATASVADNSFIKNVYDIADCGIRSGFCDQCVKASSKCYYCSADRICRPYPYKQGFPTLAGECSLREAHWATCSMNLLTLVILIGIGVGLVVLSFLSCCCWCWIRKRRNNQRDWQRLEEKQQRDKEERIARNAEKQEERKAKWDGMRQKYGLAKNDEE